MSDYRRATMSARTTSTALLLLSVFRSAVKDLAALWNISWHIIDRNIPIGLSWPINGAKKAFWNHLELPLLELQAPELFFETQAFALLRCRRHHHPPQLPRQQELERGYHGADIDFVGGSLRYGGSRSRSCLCGHAKTPALVDRERLLAQG